jgi:fibronectin-binding autotransporter adhesin
MASYTWTGGNGSWGNLADWNGGQATVLPTAADSVTIGVPGITVKIGKGVAAMANTLNVVDSTLSLLKGGSLYTSGDATFSGTYLQSGGTYTCGGLGATFNDDFVQTGGTINVLSGAIQLYDGGTLNGTLTGTGALDVVNGSAYVNTGFACTLNNIVIGADGGKLGFDIDFNYAKNLTLLSNGSLDLFGNTLTLSGTSLIEGVVGFGEIIDSGTMTASTPQYESVFDNGVTVLVTGTFNQNGNMALGSTDAGAKVNIGKTGSYLIDGNWLTYNPSSVGSIVNAGLFAKTFGGKTATIDASLTSSGTIKAEIGTLLLNGLVNSISGTVSGAGTLGIAGGQTTFGSNLDLLVTAVDQQSGILVLNKALTYSNEWDLSGGVLNLNSSAATLTLNGATDFDGGTLTSFGGALVLNGLTHAGNVTIGGPTEIYINNVFDQTNTITLGLSSNPTVNIAAGASWVVEADSAIYGFYGEIKNNGTFSEPNGSGDAYVQCEIVNTGTITANNSTLTLAGLNYLSGTLTGNGLLELAGTTYLENGLGASVDALTVDNSYVQLETNLTYDKAFAEVGGNADFALAGHTLTLNGTASLDAGLLSDGGVLTSSGATVIGNFNIDGGSDLTIAGVGEQTGQLNLAPGDGNGTLTIAKAGSYTLDDDLNIVGGGSLDIAGTFTAASTGFSQIFPTVTQTGVLHVDNQTLQLGGGGSFAGTIDGTGTLEFSSFNGIATYQLLTGLSFSSAGWSIGPNAVVDVLAAVTYGGLFQESGGATLALSAHTLTLSGTASLSGGAIAGGGTLLSSGNGTFANISVINGAVLDVTGSAEQNATIQVGEGSSGQLPPSTAMLLVGASGSYTLDENSSIIGNGTLSVAGTLTAAANGVSQIGATIVDTGVIAANLGTLDVLSAVGGTGAFSIGTGGLLEFSATSTITASNTISFTTGSYLEIDNTANFGAHLAHFSTGDVIDLPGFNASSITGSFSAGDTILTVSDTSGDSAQFTFTTAQTPSAFSFGADSAHGGVAAVFHS